MLDSKLLFVQADGDGGDCAHRSGTMAACWGLSMKSTFPVAAQVICNSIIEELSLDSGTKYIRHWDKTKFWPDGKQIADPKNFSRDQASRVALAFAVNGRKAALLKWLLGRVENFGLHQNGDLPGIGEPAVLIRGFDLWFLWPVLLILDLKFLGDLYFRKKQLWDYDTLMLPDLVFALKKYWTPTAWIAAKLYKRTDFIERIAKNHAIENNGCFELRAALRVLGEKL